MTKLALHEFRALKVALLDAFSTRENMEVLARRAQEKSLDQLAMGSNLEDIVEKIIWRAEEEVWLEKLIGAAHELRQTHEELGRIYKDWHPVLSLVPVNHYKILFLQGRQILIDRQKLRDAVCELEGDDGARILIVDGDSGTGKSYSVQFISYLAEKRRTFKFVWADLEKLPKSPRGTVGPVTLGQTIANQMNLVGMPDPSATAPGAQEQGSTWVQSFCDWLTGMLQHDPTYHWIVMDGFGKTVVEQATHDLTYELAIRSYLNLPTLRLVLLSYQDRHRLQGTVSGSVEYERIAPIGERELVVFFSDLYAEHRRRQCAVVDEAQLTAELTPHVIGSVQRVLADVKAEVNAKTLDGGRLPLAAVSRHAAAEAWRIIRASASGAPLAPGSVTPRGDTP